MAIAIGDDYFDGTSPLTRVKRHLELARRVGASYLRCSFTWNAIEPQPGVYDWAFEDTLVNLAEQYHIQLIPYVAYPPAWAVRDAKDFWKQPPRDPQIYAHFISRIVSRYRGRIAAWEIWNEPDNTDYWTGSVDDFAALVKASVPRLRASDPNARVVLGGLAHGPSPFFRRLISEYHIDREVDVVAVHAYPETWTNERAETVFEQWIPELWDAMGRDGSRAELWLNEMGYADYRYGRSKASIYGTNVFYGYEHTANYQAAMLFKFEVMALASRYVSLAGWYRVDDFSRNEKRLGSDLVNYHLGLENTKGQPKPALLALRFFERLLGAATRGIEPHITRGVNSQSVVKVFQRADGQLIVVAWLRSSTPGEVSDNSGVAVDRRSETISIDLPCAHPAFIGSFDPEGRPVNSTSRVSGQSLQRISLAGGRVFIAELQCIN